MWSFKVSISPFLIFSVFALIPSSFSFGKHKSHRTYNERCVPYDATGSCDSSQNLLCLDSGLKGYRCLCPTNKLHSQVFDHKRNSCVGKVFNACVPNVKAKGNALNDSLCVANAYCNEKLYRMPICVCKDGYVDTEEGHCMPSIKYGDKCFDSDDDSAKSDIEGSGGEPDEDNHPNKGKKCDKGQICVDGKCQCRYPTEQFYDAKDGKCVSFVDGRCTHGDTVTYSCVPNAHCHNAHPVRLHAASAHPHPSPIGLLPPLPPFLDGLVQAAKGSSSRDGDDTDEETSIFMMPLRPRLPSHPPHHSPPHFRIHAHLPPHPPPLTQDDSLSDFDEFDNFDFKARSIFFGQSGSKGQKTGYEQPKCRCLPGFSKTSSGFCMKSYMSKCSPEDEDGINQNVTETKTRELCNAEQFLECMDGHDGTFSCQCRNPMNEVYDNERNECVAMIGRNCRAMGQYPKCQNGSECFNGICQCVNGTSLTPMNTCKKNYLQGCEPGECNGHKGLTCHGKSKTCLCVDSYLKYDERKEACVASKGSVCGNMRNGNRFGRRQVDVVFVECEDGTECKGEEVEGEKMPSRCI